MEGGPGWEQLSDLGGVTGKESTSQSLISNEDADVLHAAAVTPDTQLEHTHTHTHTHTHRESEREREREREREGIGNHRLKCS